MERSDAELVQAACRGEIASFRVLYERHYRMAVGVAYSRISDRHLAEDAAQEAFAVACRKLATLNDGTRFPQWLGTIVRRMASRLSRTRVNHQPLDDETAVAPEPQQPSTLQCVREAVDQLPNSAREVIVLHYFSELSYEEISRALGISTQAVHGRLQRARNKLAAELGRRGTPRAK